VKTDDEKAAEGNGRARKSLLQPNVKHQRARATASRVNGTISLRALRCMR
jgi:hypothetical protein